MQRRDLRRRIDVEGRDLDAARMCVGEVVQQGSRVAAHRSHHVPPPLQEFRGHGEAKTTGGSDEQDGGDRLG